MMTQQMLAEHVAALDQDLSRNSVECGVDLYLSDGRADSNPIAIETCRRYARAMERCVVLARRALQQDFPREERVRLERPAASATSTATVDLDLTPLGNIVSREWANAKRANVERARLELWGYTSAIADTPASALQWRGEAAPATVQLLTAKATNLAADAGGTVSAWETHLLTDALPYNSAMAIEVSSHGSMLYFAHRGLTFKQVETVLKVNSEVFGLLPKRSQPFEKDDDRFHAMVLGLGGPPLEGNREAWWGDVFIPRWNAAGFNPRYDDWHEPYQRHQRLMEKLRPCLPQAEQ
jgi:hypothetical protein